MHNQNKNFLKEKIKSGQPIIGTWNTLASPLITEVLARSGFDFLIIDFEHGPFDISKVYQYVNACERYECSPIIRIPHNSSWMSLQALDQGAHGIMIPGINEKEDASNFVSSIKYYPKGNRGFTPFSKAGLFTNLNNKMHPTRANDFTLTSIIIESIEGINNIDDILTIQDLDIIYFGAYDLSQDLGVPGDVFNNKVVSTIEIAVNKVISAGKIAGAFVPQSKDEIKRLLEMGIKLITYNVDCDIIYRSVNDVVKWFHHD
jgi:4-hydroxy-2-oxoheptanedioate aldolase